MRVREWKALSVKLNEEAHQVEVDERTLRRMAREENEDLFHTETHSFIFPCNWLILFARRSKP